MIGIYKIENLLNHKIYIGQSVHIERRWTEHCFPSSNSVISNAIKKYGKENFSFQILEECNIQDLDAKEYFYIKQYNSIIPNGYNVTDYIDGKPTLFVHYDKEILLNIIKDLKEQKLSILQIAEKYDLNKTTIYRINSGEIHHQTNEQYPIRIVTQQKKQSNYCKMCGAEITSKASLCCSCYALSLRKTIRPNREELKNLIRATPFTKIGEMFGVSDNAVRKWCKTYNLPYKSSEIKKIDKEDWEQI